MLVKLGNAWVDPSRVEILAPEGENVSVVTPNRAFTVAGEVNEFAEIVNSALQTSSYGGAPDEEKINSEN